MAIPNGVILIWTGTHASIPSGWSRETALDDKYPKAWGAQNPNVTGGSNTHTHAGGHTHTLIGHGHSYQTEWSTEQTSGDYSGSNPDGGENNLCAKHKHGTSTTTATSGGSLVSNGSWQSANNEPPYYKVIFIKPSSTVGIIQAGICSHFYGSSAPIGWNFCNGSNSTPDLRNKYLKGASTNADAGAGSGGTSHSHTVTHNHTADAHGHTGQTNNNDNPYGSRQSNGVSPSDGENSITHSHLATLANSTDTINNYTKTDAGSGDIVEVAYKKLGVIRNAFGGDRKGLVGLWLGSVASIPVNWALCDGNNGTHDLRDKFIKIGADLTENNQTGGSNTHSHTAVSHTHTPTGTHSHSGTVGISNNNYWRRSANGGAGIVRYYDTHRGALLSINSVTSSYSTDNMTSDTVNNEPAYRTVAYIQLIKVPVGGSMLMA